MPNSLSFNVISYLRLASNPAEESWKRFVNVALIIGFQLGILADYPAEASMDNNSGENVLSSNKLITRDKGERNSGKDRSWVATPCVSYTAPNWLIAASTEIRHTVKRREPFRGTLSTGYCAVQSRPSIICTFLSGAFISRAQCRGTGGQRW